MADARRLPEQVRQIARREIQRSGVAAGSGATMTGPLLTQPTPAGGDSGTVTVVTAVDFATSKRKTRVLTIENGLITDIGDESGWT